MTTASGIPLAFRVTAANEPDVRHLLPLLDHFPRIGGRRGRPPQRPGLVIADKGYDSERLRQELRRRGIEPRIPRRGRPPTFPVGRERWPVERTLSWVKQFGKLQIRRSRCLTIHNALFYLASTVIAWRCLQL